MSAAEGIRFSLPVQAALWLPASPPLCPLRLVASRVDSRAGERHAQRCQSALTRAAQVLGPAAAGEERLVGRTRLGGGDECGSRADGAAARGWRLALGRRCDAQRQA